MDGVQDLAVAAIEQTRTRLQRAYAGQQFYVDARQALHALEAASRTLDRSDLARASELARRAGAGARAPSEDAVATRLDELVRALVWLHSAQSASREGEGLLRRLAGEHGGSVATTQRAEQGE